jgi:hypothetical protein
MAVCGLAPSIRDIRTLMELNARTFGIAAHTLGAALGTGSQPVTPALVPGAGSPTGFGPAVGGGSGNPFLDAVRGSVRSLTSAVGLTAPSDPITIPALDKAKLASFTAKEQSIDLQIAALQKQAATTSGGGPSTISAGISGSPQQLNQQIASLELQKVQTHGQALDFQATAAGTYADQVRSQLLGQFKDATGFETFLQPGGSDVFAALRAAHTAPERTRLSDQLQVALGVGVASLDHLRAQIQYYDYLGETGQLTAQQTAELGQLTKQYAGSSQQLAVLRQARERFERANGAVVTTLTRTYEQTEQKVGTLVQAQEEVSGRSIATGQPVDWDKLTAAQKQQELTGAVSKIRQLDQQVVYHHDASGFRQLQQQDMVGWDDFERRQDDADRRADEASDAAAQRKGEDTRIQDRRLAQNHTDAAQRQQAADHRGQEHHRTFQRYLAALDQSHAQSRRLATA